MSFGFGKKKEDGAAGDAGSGSGDAKPPAASPFGGKSAGGGGFGAGGGGGSGGFGAKTEKKDGETKPAGGFGGGGGGFGASASGVSGTAAAATTPAQPSLIDDINRAIQAEWIGDSLAKSIKSKLAKPFAQGASSAAPSDDQCQQFDLSATELLFLLRVDQGAVGNLAPTMGGIAGDLASNLCSFLMNMAQHTSQPQHTMTMWSSTAQQGGSKAPRVPAPTRSCLYVSQCLYLLTKAYQLQEKHIKEFCSLLDTLMKERIKIIADVAPGSPLDVATSSTLYMVCICLMNVLNVKVQLRGANGDLQDNALLKSGTVHTGLQSWLRDVQTHHSGRQEEQGGMSALGDAFGSGKSGFGSKPAPAPAAPAAQTTYRDDESGHPSPVEGFVSIVMLALGIFMKGRGDEDAAMDVMLDAFRGEREDKAVLAAAQVPFGGHVCKHLYKLMPKAAMLKIPRWLLADTAFQAIEFVIAEALPVVKHVADLDIASFRAFLQSDTIRQQNEQMMNGNANNGGYYNGGGYGLGNNANQQNTAQLVAFASDTSHMLKLLTVCAGELPTYYFEQTSVSHFIFSNLMTHLRQVFDTHKTQNNWAPYTLKLCTSYYQLLTALSRNKEFAVKIFQAGQAEAQMDCSDLRWQSVLAQCRDCAGVSSSNFASFGVNDFDQANSGANASRNRTLGGLSNRIAYTQMTSEYHDLRHSKFTTAVLSLLEQINLSAGNDVSLYKLISVDDIFSLVVAPKLTQPMAGAIFSLLATMITSRDAFTEVWRRASDMQLFNLHSAPVRESHTGVISGHHEGHDIASHCVQEMRLGASHLTKGVLRFLYSSFRYASVDSNVKSLVKFVADEIVCGVTRRSYTSEDEMYEVAALGNAVLSRVFELRLLGTGSDAFHVIMATGKAPSSVVADLTHIVNTLSARDAIRTPAAVCCLRHTLELLIHALECEKQYQFDLFTFDARTVISIDFAREVLHLVCVDDAVVVRNAMKVAAQIQDVTMSGAVQGIANADLLLQTFASYLRGDVATFVVDITVPPSLWMIEEENTNTPQEVLAANVKSEILDLMLRFAAKPLPSVTSWLCGFDIHGSANAPMKPVNCFTTIINSLNNAKFVKSSGELAVQYATLVRAVIEYPPTYTQGLRTILRGRGALDYWNDIYSVCTSTSMANPEHHSTPDDFQRYGIIMRTIAVELFHLRESGHDDLLFPHVRRMLPATPNAHSTIGNRSTTLDGTAVFGASPAGVEDDGVTQFVEFARWVPEVLSTLPQQPQVNLPHTSDELIYYLEDGKVPQYNIAAAYYLLKKHDSHHMGGMTNEEQQQLLEPLLESNACFRTYHKAACFVEGWCQLVETMCARAPVASLSLGNMVSLLDVVTKSVTMASHTNEQIIDRISSVLARTTVAIVAVIRERVAGMGPAIVASPTKTHSPTGRHSSSFPMGRDSTDSTAQNENRLTPATTAALNDILRVMVGLVIRMSSNHTVRYNLNMSLLLLLSLPAVEIDSLSMFRFYDHLFPLIAEDATSSRYPCSVRLVALHALLRLLGSDKAAVKAFATDRGSTTSSALMSTFVGSVLSMIDQICVADSSSGSSAATDAVSTINAHTDAAFAVFSAIAETHALQLHATNVISIIGGMRCWSLIEASINEGRCRNHDVSHRLLLATLKFMNVFLRKLAGHEHAALLCAEFVKDYQVLFRHVYDRVTHEAESGIMTITLELLEQSLLLLFNLSRSSTINSFTPELIDVFRLGHLLHIITLPDFRQGAIFVPEGNNHAATAKNSEGSVGLSSASDSQAATLSRSVANLLYFILNCFDDQLINDLRSNQVSSGKIVADYGGGGDAAASTFNEDSQRCTMAELSLDGPFLLGILKHLAAASEESTGAANGSRQRYVQSLGVVAHLVQLEYLEQQKRNSDAAGPAHHREVSSQTQELLTSALSIVEIYRKHGFNNHQQQQQQQQTGNGAVAASGRYTHFGGINETLANNGDQLGEVTAESAWGLAQVTTKEFSDSPQQQRNAAVRYRGSEDESANAKAMLDDTRNALLHLQSVLNRKH